MCGICGLIRVGPGGERLEPRVRAMTASLAHRGPDDEGTWVDEAAGVALGQRRLAIIDLSPEGHQPMTSASGRFVVTFNGEIYNYQELREELGRDVHWRGSSDTEVLLAAIERWGLAEALRRSVGMFALGLWDRDERTLRLARDRIGKKPLAYARAGDVVAFGSEIRALETLPAFDRAIDRDAVALHLRHAYVPAPRTIYAAARKVPPGSILTLPEGRLERYWDPRSLLAAPERKAPVEQLVDGLDGLLRLAVRQRMIADVPLGALLSGGIDSSTIVALMQAQSREPVRTFTIGIEDEDYNEAEHAKAIAKHLGTQHTELYVTPREAIETIQRIGTLYDEPFGDSSQIPTFLVSRLARKHVTVALSGDGGDEMFGGYNRYVFARSMWSKARRVPYPLRRGAGWALQRVPASFWDKTLRRVPRVNNAVKMAKVAEALQARSGETIYRSFITGWKDAAEVAQGASPSVEMDLDWPASGDLLRDMMYADIRTYLPDDILVKVDRASMAVGLEVRAPFLDARVADYAWSLPSSAKIAPGGTKWILREVLARYVPREMFERPKMGFGIPVGRWLRGPLRDWADDLLSEKRLREDGLLDVPRVRRRWQEHLDGTQDWQHQIWSVLMLQAWLQSRQ